MSQPPQRIGSYPIEREVGRGGMGVVYLARDPRLERSVAIKVLPDELSADAERLARFEREARLLASVHHPNIAGIYGLEHDGDRRFLVLEYVEGETLAERLERGPMPLEETMDLCRQIAAALEAAHETGIIHRDLKPGNVKLTPAGEVKVLDFGLAKGGGSGTTSSATDLSQSPTLVPAATMEGVILGTAAYMSPEQARGRAVDKRTDIWAFGCVLFECLTGQQAFVGETVSDTIARILRGEPDWGALPPQTPERLRDLLRRCLEKDARRRLRDIGDARLELEELESKRVSSAPVGVAAAHGAGRSRYAREIAIAVFAAVASMFAMKLGSRLIHFGPPDPATLATRFEVLHPPGMDIPLDPACAALSPDGRKLALVASDSSGTTRLWVRSLESLTARPLPGTEDVQRGMFWSPDSRTLGFFTEGKLKKVAADGNSPPEDLCDVKRARGGSWGKDGTILFAPFSDGPIDRIAAAGGDPAPVTVVDSTHGESGERFPFMLPDGKHFLYSSLPAKNGKFDIRLGSLDSRSSETVLAAESGVVYASGWVLYTRGGRLVAQRFRGLRPRGEVVTIGDLAGESNLTGAPSVTASLHGSLAYFPVQFENTRLVWMDKMLHEISQVPLDPGPWQLGSLSPDDRQVVLQRPESMGQTDLWIADLERGVATRATYEVGNSVSPAWSPDGTRIAYLSENHGPQIIRVKAVSSNATESYLQNDHVFKFLNGWTKDGKYLVYGRQDPLTRWDIWLLPMQGDHTPVPYLVTPFNEGNPQPSPDGRWMAYASDETGQQEVYVQSFPQPGNKYQVTNHGAELSGWSEDGKSLIYRLRTNLQTVLSAPVLPGPTFRLGPPHPFGQAPEGLRGGLEAHHGGHLLVSLAVGKQPAPEVIVLQNWPAALAKR
jgi:Tol biopolymer transport system component